MKDAKWRVIQLQSHNAFMNMAIDEAVSESVAKGQYPTIRFYKWLPSAVSVGYFQSLKDEVNIQNCKELGIDIIRRRTGGGAVYHSNRGEITYSVIGPTKLFPKNKLLRRKLVDGYSVMEIKFRKHVPSWFHRIMIKYQLQRVPISKYCKGMERSNLITVLD